MVPVDDQRVLMANRRVPMGMTMRLGSLTALVLVLMVLIVNVQVAVLHLGVLMHHFNLETP